jgi:hypothetical protein
VERDVPYRTPHIYQAIHDLLSEPEDDLAVILGDVVV